MDPSPPPPANSAPPDKHTAMIQRLSDLHQSRLQHSAARRSDPISSSPAFESVHSFLDRFSAAKTSITSALSLCRSLPPGDPSLKPSLDNISASIADLDRLLADNSYFLPSYEVRSSLSAIADLKDALDAANSDLFPRKKFSFKNKTKPPTPTPTHTPTPTPTPTHTPTSSQQSNSPSLQVFDSPGFRNKEGQVIVKRFSRSGMGEFTLADLNSCDIYLKGSVRSLFIHRLRDCRVFTGPVLGSILIDDVEGCLFMLASHQIRIHEARRTDFYLRVRSRPIVEGCSGVRFAPYQLFYEGIEAELRDSGLAEEMGNWANVDDFKWLRAVQSPNWCVIPEEERVETVVVTDLEEQDGGD